MWNICCNWWANIDALLSTVFASNHGKIKADMKGWGVPGDFGVASLHLEPFGNRDDLRIRDIFGSWWKERIKDIIRLVLMISEMINLPKMWMLLGRRKVLSFHSCQWLCTPWKDCSCLELLGLPLICAVEAQEKGRDVLSQVWKPQGSLTDKWED